MIFIAFLSIKKEESHTSGTSINWFTKVKFRSFYAHVYICFKFKLIFRNVFLFMISPITVWIILACSDLFCPTSESLF
jgi:hypothetical protein